ncbi:MAG: mechanosensitive ion channel [Candidatus Omnitrophica bacterium]|nr:mechanosensitive ion channel [Candidatus Omnitrophota bacterium]
MEYANNRVMEYLIAAGIFCLGYLLMRILKFFVLRKLKVWAEKTRTWVDDFLICITRNVGFPLAYFVILYLALRTLTLPAAFDDGMGLAVTGVLTFFTARFFVMLAGCGFKLYCSYRTEQGTLMQKSLQGIMRLIKVLIWVFAVIFLLDNLGYNVSTVVAGLGIGGVAVALAAQTVLGDLFSYFAILFDRPFELGDFIITGDYLGVIEHIGIKTTRIRSLGGEQLIFSNTDLTNSRIRNYKRMERRRVVFKFGVTYETPLERLKEIPPAVEEIVKSIPDTAFDRAHFFSFGNFSLDFEVVYYILGSDYNKYMDIQQTINLALKERFETSGIDFAYPTQLLYLQKYGNSSKE